MKLQLEVNSIVKELLNLNQFLMSKKFIADTRGLGGQKTVMDMMSGHYSALVNVKSTMNTREKPFVHVKK